MNKKLNLLVLVLSSVSWLPAANAQTVSVSPNGVLVQGGTAQIKADSAGSVEVRSGGRTNDAKSRSQVAGTGNVSVTAIGAGAHAETNIAGRSSSASSSTKAGTGGEYVNEDLSGQNLVNAKFAGKRFVNVDLSRATLRNADLAGASLVNTSLVNANLAGANLKGAQLVNVELDGANLADATWIDGRRCRAGSVGECR